MSRAPLVRSLAQGIALLTLAAHVDAADLFVSSTNTSEVVRYDGAGTLAGVFAAGSELIAPVGLAFGPDRHLYVASLGTSQILRYHGATGAFLGVFASGGGLSEPSGLAFGPDGNLYVSDRPSAHVLRYDGDTGAFIDVFTSGGDLRDPIGLAFGPDGRLYVSGSLNNQVLRYDGDTGAFIGAFASGGGLNGPAGLAFAPGGDLYVSSAFSHQVLRYDGATGAFAGALADAALRSPYGLAFGPDGRLYVSSAASGQVRRYDAATGALVDVFADGDALDFPTHLAFAPPPGPASREVAIDVKPGSCPNVLSVSDRTFPVAILGSASFDVAQVDPATVKLNGVPALRNPTLSDVTGPARTSRDRDRQGSSGCASRPRDGFKDLVLKFDLRDVLAADGDDGERTVLRLTGTLKAAFGGTPIAGQDVVVVRDKRSCRGGRH